MENLKKEAGILARFALFIIVIVAAVMGVMSLTSCHRTQTADDIKIGAGDSAYVKKALDVLSNPTFTSIEDLYKYRQRVQQERFNDSVFSTLPEETFDNVATVVYNRDGVLSKEAIVKEYLHGADIYKNLEVNLNKPRECIKSDTINDTIINGKHFKLVKEEITHVH